MLTPFIKTVSHIVYLILGILLFLPLSVVVPKKRDRISVIGRHNGLFMDNSKHMFLYLCNISKQKPEVCFISNNTNVTTSLKQANLPSLSYPSIAAIYYLLTSNIVIVDSAEWISGGKTYLTYRSKVLQLWHGIPLKQIELMMYQRQINKLNPIIRPAYKFYKTVQRRYQTVEMMLSTSANATETAFEPSIPAFNYLDFGYPRNDVLFDQSIDLLNSQHASLNIDKDTIAKINQKRNSVSKVVLIAPTFRKGYTDPLNSKALSIERLNEFSREHKILVVFKLHPVLATIELPAAFDNLLFYETTADIYPALPLFDALITDYSSIYFDYLLLNRPIVFYPFDLDQYSADDRPLMYPYDDVTPGPKCFNQTSLEKEIINLDQDSHSAERAVVANRFFTHFDGESGKRIWRHIKENYLNS